MSLPVLVISTQLAFIKLEARAEPTKPNIILIFVDDMGYGDPGCYGGSLVPTPHIDALAATGLRFTQGYSISPVCGPSRVGLLSGLQPSRLGVYWNPDMGAVRMPESHPILPEALRTAGYITGLVGKWNLNNPSWDPMPAHNYFDHSYAVMVWEGDYWPDEQGRYKGVDDRNYGSSKQSGLWGPNRAGDEYLTDRLSRHACEFIAEQKDNPFFLMLAYNAPHSPLHGKRAHRNQLEHIQSEALKLYASMVLSVDEGVGRVLETLESGGIRENTLVLFISDNGPALTHFKGMPPSWPRGELLGSTAGLRGNKGTFYEGGIRVPFILNWPAVMTEPRVNHSPITTLDLYPTLCAIAGTKPRSHTQLDGLDLSPLILKQAHLTDRRLLWFSGDSGAVRDGNWKFYFSPKDGASLFNLDQDPGETNDRSAEAPEIATQLATYIEAWREQIPPPVTPREPR